VNLGKLLRIARWEASRTVGTLDRRTAMLGAAAVAVAVAAAGGAALGFGTPPNDDIYAVAVDEESPFADPVAAATALEPVPPGSEAVVAVVDPDPTDRRAGVTVADGPKGEAALSVYRRAVQRYNNALMDAEPNETAAFPVLVTVEYTPQEVTDPTATPSTAVARVRVVRVVTTRVRPATLATARAVRTGLTPVARPAPATRPAAPTTRRRR
jgi:ABC-type Na+ efflux pump permease subunit